LLAALSLASISNQPSASTKPFEPSNTNTFLLFCRFYCSIFLGFYNMHQPNVI
jgi:hypothetical protein